MSDEENKTMSDEEKKTILEILEAEPYEAFNFYKDILYESDEIAQMLKDVFFKYKGGQK